MNNSLVEQQLEQAYKNIDLLKIKLPDIEMVLKNTHYFGLANELSKKLLDSSSFLSQLDFFTKERNEIFLSYQKAFENKSLLLNNCFSNLNKEIFFPKLFLELSKIQEINLSLFDKSYDKLNCLQLKLVKQDILSSEVALDSLIHKKQTDYYDNYDAIEVSKVKDIPMDYEGTMGVPITFLDKHNPEQFEILGNEYDLKIEKGRGYIGGKRMYGRIFIKHKKLGS